MSRDRLREALRRREAVEAGGAVVPRVQAHAARLEQVTETQAASDAEALARALRNAQALYGYDAVTVGACGTAVAAACQMAVGAASAPVAALRLVARREPLRDLPLPPDVVAAPSLELLRETLRRVRPVLGSRAGTAVVLPTPAHLAEQTGGDADWAVSVLMEVVRFFGAEEPDLFLAVGPSARSPLPAIAEFFGAGWVEPEATAGVVTVSCRAMADGTLDGVAPGWLFTTDDEVPAGADPRVVAQGLSRLGCAGVPSAVSDGGGG